jgi:hypothetical protein
MVACLNRRFELLKILLTPQKGESDGYRLSLAQTQQHIYNPGASKLLSPKTIQQRYIKQKVNEANNNRLTPLHVACLNGDV